MDFCTKNERFLRANRIIFTVLLKRSILLLLFANQVAAQSFDFPINPRSSYLGTTIDDQKLLNQQVEEMSPVDKEAPKGFDLKNRGFNPGDYVRLYSTGTIRFGRANGDWLPISSFDLGLAFTPNNNGLDLPSKAKRFLTGDEPIQVNSLTQSQWNTWPMSSGAGGATLDSNIPGDFRVGNGIQNSVIVQIPPSGLFLRHTVIDQIASGSGTGDNLGFKLWPITGGHLWPVLYGDNRDPNGNAKLRVEKVPITQRPRYWIEAPDHRFTEGTTSATIPPAKIRIRRDQGNWTTGTPPQYRTVLYYTFHRDNRGGVNPAEAGEDFTETTGGVVWEPGQDYKDIPVPLLGDDTKYEKDETFLFRIYTSPIDNPNEAFIVHYDPNNTNPRNSLEVPVTIVENDPLPAVSFAAASWSTIEGNKQASLKFKLDRESEFSVTVGYDLVASSAAAEVGKDFNFTIQSKNFTVPPKTPAGTLHEVPLTIIDDNIYEPTEKITLRLTVKAGEATYNGSTSVLDIIENDSVPTVSFSPIAAGNNIMQASVDEPTTGEITYPMMVHLSHPSSTLINVWYAHDLGMSVAAETKDFIYPPAVDGSKKIQIIAGDTSAAINLKIPADSLYEGSERVVFALGSVASAAIYDREGANGRLALTINDAQTPPNVSISRLGPSSEEENVTSRLLRFSLSGKSAYPTTVRLSYTGTAMNGSDFTGPSTIPISEETLTHDFPLVIENDSVPEFAEVAIVSVSEAETNGQPLGFGTRSTEIIIDDDDGGVLESTVGPSQLKLAGNASANLAVAGLNGDAPVLGLWRVAGEPGWRQSGTSVTGLAAGFHEIEFRPFDGYLAPPTRIIHVPSGGSWQLPVGEELNYMAIDPPAPVGLRVNLLGATGGQWKLDGETAWRDSGSSLENLPISSYKIHFNPPAGFQRPAAITRRLNPANTINEFNIQLIAVPSGTPPMTPVPLEGPVTDGMPHSFVGRISTSNGFGTGTAVGPNSVLTAAHVLFDDRTLGYVTDVRYQNQAHKDYYQPSASEELEIVGEVNAQGFTVNGKSSIKPRGWVMLSGYAERRTEDLDAGMGSGSSGIESQNRDVAVAYFGKEVARGGKIGVRVATAAGQWLNEPGEKSLFGYSLTQAAYDDVGKMHASVASENITFSQTYLRVFRSNDLVAGPGVSGGPLVIRGLVNTAESEWKVAAVYLGESVFGVYREIDQDVADIIGYAQLLSGDDSAGDNIPIANTTRSTSFAQLEVRCNQPAATWRNGWSPIPRKVYDPITLQEMDFEVRFSDLDGWITPSVIRGRGVAGKNTVVTGHYIAKSYGTLASALAIQLPATPLEELGPLGDLNRNGMPNMIEWAFNLDPSKPGLRKELTPSNGTSGLPLISVVGADSVRRLKVEFVRIKFAVNPNLRYVPEFTSSLDENTWTASGQIISRASIDDVWERVVVEDTVLNAPTRFARLRVEEIPASN